MLFIPYAIASVVDNGSSHRTEPLTELYRRIDTIFLDVFDDLNIIKGNASTLKNIDAKNPITPFLKQIRILSQVAFLPVIEEKEFGKIYNIIFYKFRDLFVVKLTVRPKGSWYKIKDVEFFSIQECTGSQFSSAIVGTSSHISSVELFKQMTFAGKRFIKYCAQQGKKDALEVVKWINNYHDLLTATCMMCHRQVNPFGKDAFMVPALRHFDTGSALHSHCCKGDLVLRT